MTAAESQRAELFHTRLETPIGELPEERAATKQDEEAVSPFGIVGICVVVHRAFDALRAAVYPEQFPRVVNVILGLVLVTIGGLMAWASRRSRLAKAALAAGEGS